MHSCLSVTASRRSGRASLSAGLGRTWPTARLSTRWNCRGPARKILSLALLRSLRRIIRASFPLSLFLSLFSTNATHSPFNSPILYPSSPSLPSSLPAVAPLLSRAHPALRSLHCALLHPSTPSCALQLGEFSLATFPQLLRIASILYAATTVLRTPRAVLSAPITAIARTAVSAVRTSAWLTAAIGTAWAATCAIQHAPFPRALLLPAAARWWAAGAIAGCWAGAESGGRGAWLYALRLALVSAWGVARKRHVVGKWKGVDVAVFVAALAVIGAVFERDPQAVGGSAIRAVLVRLRGKRREELPRERGRGREKGKGGKRPEERSSGELVKTAVEKARKKM